MTSNIKNLKSNEKWFLQFSSGGEDYAADLLLVKEVLTTPKVTPIPDSPNYVCGIFNLRGLVLMVIDLKKKFGLKANSESDHSGTIIFDLGESLIGVKVDAIQKVLNIGEENIQPAPDVGGKNRVFIKGVIQHEQKLIMWLDPHALCEKIPYLKKAI